MRRLGRRRVRSGLVGLLVVSAVGCTSPVIDPARESLRMTPPPVVASPPGTATVAAPPFAGVATVHAASLPQQTSGAVGPPIVDLEQLLDRPSSEGPSVYHEVRAGETAQSIAVRYRVDVGRLVRVNGLTASMPLVPGQLLYIPDQKGK